MKAPKITLLSIMTFFIACSKPNGEEATCTIPTVAPHQPYSSPVWHPNGIILGFNHQPLSGILKYGTEPCTWYMTGVKQDSAGFYIMNKNGTGLKRMLSYMIGTPAWSPDGNWLAFSLGSNIYKIPFNGSSFDTTQIIQLTNAGGNFYPCWTASSDSIYFDSNNGTNGQAYYVWKMSSNGSGKTGFPNTGRQPFVGADNRIYYLGLQSEIFSMKKDGSDTKQLTFNSGGAEMPKVWNGNIYYQNGGISVVNTNGSFTQFDKPCVTYDISTNGEIVYSKIAYDLTTINKQIGTLWIMNTNGTNIRQLTFNNY